MTISVPRFELARVTQSGVEEVRIVPVLQIPGTTRMGRRAFLGTGIAASAALGTMVGGCGDGPAGDGAPASTGLLDAGEIRTNWNVSGRDASAGDHTGEAATPGGNASSHDAGVAAAPPVEGGGGVPPPPGGAPAVPNNSPSIGMGGSTGHTGVDSGLGSGGSTSGDGGMSAGGGQTDTGDSGGGGAGGGSSHPEVFVPDPTTCDGIRAHTNGVESVAFSPDGALLASGSLDETIKLWSVPDGALVTILPGHDQWIHVVAFSPNGALLASGSSDTSIKLWSMPDGALVTTLNGHTARVGTLAFSPDGTVLATGSWDNTIKLWSIPSGALITSLTGHNRYVNALAFSPDGTVLASGSDDKTVKLWAMPAGTLITTLTGHKYAVTALAIAPNGAILASGCTDHTVNLWNLPSGTLLATLQQTDSVQAVAFNPGGTLLAVGTFDNPVSTEIDNLKLWSIPDGVAIMSLTGQPDDVNTVAFSPDGALLASGGVYDIKLWSMPEGSLVACPMDVASSLSSRGGTQYQLQGDVRVYTLPCGTPLPTGATCTCNCVAGSVPPSSGGDPGGGSCTCDLVCTCVPVCQAHKLLDRDPVVRVMAEQILLRMGSAERQYMSWAAHESTGELRARIESIVRDIEHGRTADPAGWPDCATCVCYLDEPDPILRIMAAQVLVTVHRDEHQSSAVRSAVQAALRTSWAMHWRRRAKLFERERA